MNILIIDQRPIEKKRRANECQLEDRSTDVKRKRIAESGIVFIGNGQNTNENLLAQSLRSSKNQPTHSVTMSINSIDNERPVQRGKHFNS